jgi:beta-lactam-binding protein with PASTA domain
MHANEGHRVPNLVGETFDNAVAMLDAIGIKAVQGEDFGGVVVRSMTPAPGTLVPFNANVLITTGPMTPLSPTPTAPAATAPAPVASTIVSNTDTSPTDTVPSESVVATTVVAISEAPNLSPTSLLLAALRLQRRMMVPHLTRLPISPVPRSATEP